MEKCEWYMPSEWEDSYWMTTCGKELSFTEGTPKESEYKYCAFCGKEIEFKEESTET